MRLLLRIGITATAFAATAWLVLPGVVAAQAPPSAQESADFNLFPVQGNVSLLIGPGGINSATPNITNPIRISRRRPNWRHPAQ